MQIRLKAALSWLKNVFETTDRLNDMTQKYGWCRGDGLFLAAALVAAGLNTEHDLRSMCYRRAGLVDRRWGLAQVQAAARRINVPLPGSIAAWDWVGARSEGYPLNSPQEALHAASATLSRPHAYALIREMMGEDIANRSVPALINSDLANLVDGATAAPGLQAVSVNERVNWSREIGGGLLVHTTANRWIFTIRTQAWQWASNTWRRLA